MGVEDLRTWPRAALEAELTRLEAGAPRVISADGAAAESTVTTLLETLEREMGRSRVDALLGNVAREARALRGGDRWIPWAEVERIFDALEPLAATGVARRAGAATLDLPLFETMRLGAQTVGSLDLLYPWALRVVAGPGGLLFRGCEADAVRTGSGVIEIRFAPPAGGRLPIAWIEATAGRIARLTRIAGFSIEPVEVERDGPAAVYRVRHSPASALERFRALVRTPRTAVDRAIETARIELHNRNEELRRRIEELEQSERERAELSARVAERQRMEVVGRFAGGVAHDFNNLLTAALAHIERLESALDDEEPHRDIAAMRSAAEQAAALSRQLLSVGRRQRLDLAVVALDDVLRSSETLLASATSEPVTVRFALGCGEARVEADVKQLERALVELALNAAEAMPDGGELVIETSIVDADEARSDEPIDPLSGPIARISICDRGSGMTPEVRSRALDPYFSTHPERHAAGLGLPSVYGLVRQLGGTLSLRSDPGTGTTVHLYLPLVEGS